MLLVFSLLISFVLPQPDWTFKTWYVLDSHCSRGFKGCTIGPYSLNNQNVSIIHSYCFTDPYEKENVALSGFWGYQNISSISNPIECMNICDERGCWQDQGNLLPTRTLAFMPYDWPCKSTRLDKANGTGILGSWSTNVSYFNFTQEESGVTSVTLFYRNLQDTLYQELECSIIMQTVAPPII